MNHIMEYLLAAALLLLSGAPVAAATLPELAAQVEKMSREQAQDFLIKLYEQMIVRENMYKEFLKHEWGIEPRPQFES